MEGAVFAFAKFVPDGEGAKAGAEDDCEGQDDAAIGDGDEGDADAEHAGGEGPDGGGGFDFGVLFGGGAVFWGLWVHGLALRLLPCGFILASEAVQEL